MESRMGQSKGPKRKDKGGRFEEKEGRKERSENETSARLKRGPQARRQMQ